MSFILSSTAIYLKLVNTIRRGGFVTKTLQYKWKTNMSYVQAMSKGCEKSALSSKWEAEFLGQSEDLRVLSAVVQSMKHQYLLRASTEELYHEIRNEWKLRKADHLIYSIELFPNQRGICNSDVSATYFHTSWIGNGSFPGCVHEIAGTHPM